MKLRWSSVCILWLRLSVTVPLRKSLRSRAHCVDTGQSLSCCVFILALYGHVYSFRWRSVPVPRVASEKRDRRCLVPHQVSRVRWPRGAHRDPRHRGGPRGPGHAGKSSPRLRLSTRPQWILLPFKAPQTLDVTGTPVSYLNSEALTHPKRINLIKAVKHINGMFERASCVILINDSDLQRSTMVIP